MPHDDPTSPSGSPTEVSKLNAALREVEERWRTLMDNVADFVLLIDRDSKINFINRTRPTRPDVVGTFALNYLRPEYQAKLQNAIAQVFTTGKASEHLVQEADDQQSWFSVRLAPIYEGEEIAQVLAICTDTTERKQYELNLQQAHDDLEDRVEERTHELRTINQLLRDQQERLRNLLDMQNRDRLLIAFEVHDGLVQYMTAAKLYLEGCRESLAPPAMDAFDQGTTLLQKAMEEARALIGGLRPPILEGEGLESAVHSLVEEFESIHAFDIDLHWQGEFERLAPALETAIYRAVQESLHNIQKHANTKVVEVRLEQREDRIHVLIRDQGCGFDLAKVDNKRHGLFGIRERAQVLGGTVEIKSEPDQGTQIQLDLPLIVAR